jgi:ryanodine receptor 2
MYTPKPIDTAQIRLPEGITELIERLAENNHDIWAQQRTSEGWTYGPQRDDVAKKHPDLVPYDQLPESEKEYDRKMATGTIKAILALGYRIEKS